MKPVSAFLPPAVALLVLALGAPGALLAQEPPPPAVPAEAPPLPAEGEPVEVEAGAAAAPAEAAPPVIPSSVDQDFVFASGLIKLGLPEYAEMVVDKLLVQYPQMEDRANVVRAESLISRRRFPQAEAIVAKMPKDSPKAQAIMLALADGYFQVGEAEKTSGLYFQFFNRYTNQIPSDPDLLRFYRDAAYKFGQMLATRNDAAGAADMYELVIKAMPESDREMMRQVKLEQAEMLLRAARTQEPGDKRNAMLAKAEKLADEVLWGGRDLWFGRALAAMAQVHLLRGRNEAATQLLEDNMKMLKAIDEMIVEAGIPIAESPFAAARSLLGQIYKDEADLLMASRLPRENEALRYFERAADAVKNVWDIIERVNKRDASILDRAKKEGTQVSLSGSATQRQQPFSDAIALLKEFEETLGRLEEQGWDPAAVERKNKLKERIQKMLEAASQYPKEIGVTPSADVMVGEKFPARGDIKKGLLFVDAEEARKQKAVALYVKALGEFYNVFAGYPGSDWSATSGTKVTELKDRLEALTGQKVQIESKSGGREKIARVIIREGHSLFGRKEYGKAIAEYLRGVNEAPEMEESVIALANLMEAYAVMTNTIQAKAVAQYLGERFQSNESAAKGLLRVGRVYFEAQNREMYQYMYETYLGCFRDHASAPNILYMLGEQRWKNEDYEGAIPYYRRITTNYEKTPYFLKALNRIGWGYWLRSDFTNAIGGFTAYLKEAQPSPEKAQAKLCLADSYRQTGDFKSANTHYAELAEWLAPKDGPFNVSADAVKQNQEIQQQAIFFQAYCQTMLAGQGPEGAAQREQVGALYRKFVDMFPASPLAPTALSSLGAVLLGDGKSEEASKVYDELAQRYPKSEAGQNARVAMVRSLVEIGRIPKAREVMADLIRSGDTPPEQFVRVGMLFAEKGEHEAAVEALLQVLKHTEGKADLPKPQADMEQRTLIALGESESAIGRLDDAIKHLGMLVSKYPKSALFYQARFLLGDAYKKAGKADEAMEVMREVFQRATDQNLINKATIELAAIQAAQGDKAGALASYLRLILTAKADNPHVRPLLKAALVGSIELLMEMGKWQDVIENCDRYTAEFPTGERAEDVRRWRAQAITKITVGA